MIQSVVAVSAMSAVPAVLASEPSATHDEMICDKLERLTQELSEAMGEYMGGKFQAIVGPDDDVRFTPIKADAQTAKSQAKALSNALNELRPGDWQTTLNLEAGFVLIARHEPRKTFSVIEYTDLADPNRPRQPAVFPAHQRLPR